MPSRLPFRASVLCAGFLKKLYNSLAGQKSGKLIKHN